MKRKKTIRNIIIAVVVAVLIAAAVVLIITLRKDGRGMNAFERSKVVATADGESITMQDYAMMLDTIIQNYSYSSSSLTEEQIKNVQTNAATQALMQKIYEKEAKALGLTLTDEEKQAAKDSAQAQIDGVVESYTQSLVSNGTYSKAALDKQVANYYNMLGMTQNGYYEYIRKSAEASTYYTKLDAYYDENGYGFSEEEVLNSYHEAVEESMQNYEAGMYSTYLMLYTYGYATPLLFVPDGFFYVDVVEINKTTEEDINAVFDRLNSEEVTFDELLASDENVFSYKNVVDGPYAIGDDDYSYVFSEAEAYDLAKSLGVGEIGTFITPVTTKDDDGNETVTGYNGFIFRRVEGTICENGESGIINIDHYDGIRENVESGLMQEKWLGDANYTDAMYAYRGSL